MGIVRVAIISRFVISDLTYRQDEPNSVIVEPAIAIIVACGPLLRPIFEKIFPGTAMSKRSQNTGRSGDGTKEVGTNDSGSSSNNTPRASETPPGARWDGSKSSVGTSCHANQKTSEVHHHKASKSASDELGGISVDTRLDVQWTR